MFLLLIVLVDFLYITRTVTVTVTGQDDDPVSKELVFVKGGDFMMGSTSTNEAVNNNDGAYPLRKVHVRDFYIDRTTVTNEAFAKFVKETGYVTVAEEFGWSFVLEILASKEVTRRADEGLGRIKGAEHWVAVEGAYWKHPEGFDSSVEDRMDHPVVHMSYRDGHHYCAWRGCRLPMEEEWEVAARSASRPQDPYPWGTLMLDEKCNIWQGAFPSENLQMDGYIGTCPVRAFEPSDRGLYNMLGNVWEWVTYSPEGLLRGGSFLDSSDGSFNHIVTVSTRQLTPEDSGGINCGFRCVCPKDDDEFISDEL